MALQTHSDLKTAVGDWFLARGDDIDARFDDFVLLLESRLNYGSEAPWQCPALRVRQMEDTEELTLDANGDATLPTDFLEWRGATAASGGATYSLDPSTPARTNYDYPTRYGATASAFQIVGSTLRASPTTGPVTLFYYAKIPALTAAAPNDTNWLLTAYPNIYLYGCIFEACNQAAETALAQNYFGLMMAHVKGLVGADKDARWSRGVARVMGPTP